MAKQLLFDDAAWRKVQSGVSQLARVVRVTLGDAIIPFSGPLEEYVIPDYLEFNYSRAEIEQVSAYTRELARRSWEARRTGERKAA